VSLLSVSVVHRFRARRLIQIRGRRASLIPVYSSLCYKALPAWCWRISRAIHFTARRPLLAAPGASIPLSELVVHDGARTRHLLLARGLSRFVVGFTK